MLRSITKQIRSLHVNATSKYGGRAPAYCESRKSPWKKSIEKRIPGKNPNLFSEAFIVYSLLVTHKVFLGKNQLNYSRK